MLIRYLWLLGNAVICTAIVVIFTVFSKPVAPTRYTPVATLSIGSASGILWLPGDSLWPKLPYCIRDTKAQPYLIKDIQKIYKNGDTVKLVVKY